MDKLSDKIKKYESDPDSDLMIFLPEIEKIEAEKDELISFFKKIKYELNMICYDTSVLEKVNILWELIFNMEDKIESWDQITKEQE